MTSSQWLLPVLGSPLVHQHRGHSRSFPHSLQVKCPPKFNKPSSQLEASLTPFSTLPALHKCRKKLTTELSLSKSFDIFNHKGEVCAAPKKRRSPLCCLTAASGAQAIFTALVQRSPAKRHGVDLQLKSRVAACSWARAWSLPSHPAVPSPTTQHSPLARSAVLRSLSFFSPPSPFSLHCMGDSCSLQFSSIGL